MMTWFVWFGVVSDDFVCEKLELRGLDLEQICDAGALDWIQGVAREKSCGGANAGTWS